MLFLKRLVTAVFLFFFFVVVFFFGSSIVIGGVAGAQVAPAPRAHDFQSGYRAGQTTGRTLGRELAPVVLLGSVGASGVTSLLLSFFGVLPWCRRQPELPPPSFTRRF
jgi:hypothetical protein